MSVRTVREYERHAKLPSQLSQPRTYRSRPNPFADDWPWIANLLKDDPALQGQTLFGLLCDRHPGRYQEGQLRTLQRHIAAWRAVSAHGLPPGAGVLEYGRCPDLLLGKLRGARRRIRDVHLATRRCST